MKKDGKKPECFYHPNFEYLAHERRANHEASMIRAIMACGAITRDITVEF